MDSNGYKLKVRNTSGTYAASDYQVDIADTSANARAVRVDGRIRLERGGTNCGTIEPVSGGGLQINATDGDPDVRIGATDNTLYLVGSDISIGDDDAGTATTIHGSSVQIQSGNLVVNNIVSAGQLNSPRVDARGGDASLEVGTVQAPNVTIGRAAHDTQVNGTLHVSGQAHLTGGVAGPLSVDGTVVANGMNLNGSAIVSNTVVAAALDVNGNGDVSGTLSAGTLQGNALDINGNGDVSGSLTTHGHLV